MKKEGKQGIIEAAQRLIAVNGVEKTSMRAIAEEAGITTGAIYYYYKSKEDLLYDVMDYAVGISSSAMAQRRSGSASPIQVLDEIRRLVVERVMNPVNPRAAQFYLAYQAALGNEQLRGKFKVDYAGQTSRVAELFNYTFESEKHTEDACLAVLMIAALDGINLQQFAGALPVENTEIARVYNEFFSFAIPAYFRWLETGKKEE